jgi:TonB-dependent receptor
VNLVTKKASNIPELRIDVGGGYNNLEKSFGQYQFGARYNRRLFNEVLGLQASVTTESKIRSSERYSQGWDVRPDSTYWISNLTTIYTDERRSRTGGSLLLDMNLSNGGTIRLNNFYYRTDRDAIQYDRNYPIGSNVTYGILDSERELHTINNALSGEHFLGKFKLNWGASHALSLGKMPYSHEMNFVEGGGAGAGMDNVPPEDSKGPGELLIPYAFNNWPQSYLNTAFFTTSENRDRNVTAYLNLERSFALSDQINLAIKAGGKYRMKDRSSDIDRYRAPYWVVRPKSYQLLPDGTVDTLTFDGSSWEDGLLNTGGNNVSMMNFMADNPPSRTLAGKYVLNPLIDPDLAREWYDLRKNGVTNPVQPGGGLEEYNPYPDRLNRIYDITERVSAGYAMATLDLGRMFRLIAGVRIENENNDYQTTFAPMIDGFYRYEKDEIADTSASYSATYVLPNFHLRFKPVDWWDLRLAATKTLSRPDFSMRLPTFIVRTTASSGIERGNPDLKTAESWNYDAIASFYSPKYGLLTVGGFYKRLDNIFYMLNNVLIQTQEIADSVGLPAGYGSYVGLRLDEPINTSGTEVYGVEVDLQANLKFLPGFLGNFVLRGNYTWIKSVTRIRRFRFDRDNTVFPPTQTPVWYETVERMEGQPSNFGNVTLGYDLRGFSGRFSVFFQDSYLTSVDVTRLRDRFVKSYAKWDLALKQNIPKINTEIMLNVTNLSNFGEGTYWDFRGLDNGSTWYDILIDLGVRVTL